jgi:hypothetical protein
MFDNVTTYYARKVLVLNIQLVAVVKKDVDVWGVCKASLADFNVYWVDFRGNYCFEARLKRRNYFATN